MRVSSSRMKREVIQTRRISHKIEEESNTMPVQIPNKILLNYD
jgi:hypothetical protein